MEINNTLKQIFVLFLFVMFLYEVAGYKNHMTFCVSLTVFMKNVKKICWQLTQDNLSCIKMTCYMHNTELITTVSKSDQKWTLDDFFDFFMTGMFQKTLEYYRSRNKTIFKKHAELAQKLICSKPVFHN